ncbi:MAG: hypothetical protein ABIL22_09045, partial [candidate division WOR-3 bacterium]
MLLSQLTFSFFLTVLLLSLGLFYLYLRNQFDKKFLYAGLFFFAGAGFLFSSYNMGIGLSSIFWNKVMFACIFAYFYIFPHFVYDTIGKKYGK